jgi:prepilin-type N-terminal cleavage/methylation domain-containing protein
MANLKKRGFTLVELLTVVAIIALLIGILVPAVNQARKSAVKTSVRAQISGISQGLEMFRSDFGYYPSSVPQSTDGKDAKSDRSDADTAGEPINGAHRLAFALLGRDKLGCPAKRATPATPTVGVNYGPDSIAGAYYTDTPKGSFSGNAVAIGSWGDDLDQKTTRKGPYIDPKGFGAVKDTSSDVNNYLFVLTDKYDKRVEESISTTADYLNHSSILYYAANERGKRLYANAAYTTINGESIYYPQDNARIAIADAGSAAKSVHFKNGYTEENFFKFVEDEKAVIGTTHRPYNSESFLLISRGYDGIYGTADDVMNWGD